MAAEADSDFLAKKKNKKIKIIGIRGKKAIDLSQAEIPENYQVYLLFVSFL